MAELKEGEQYLKGMIPTGRVLQMALEAVRNQKDEVEFAAFYNKERTNEKQPNLKISGGGSIWVNTKKAKGTELNQL
jgi:hypothetical protein